MDISSTLNLEEEISPASTSTWPAPGPGMVPGHARYLVWHYCVWYPYQYQARYRINLSNIAHATHRLRKMYNMNNIV